MSAEKALVIISKEDKNTIMTLKPTVVDAIPKKLSERRKVSTERHGMNNAILIYQAYVSPDTILSRGQVKTLNSRSQSSQLVSTSGE